ncbi:MAG TPA: dihydrolipoyllysine-residue acetyltransferase [Luteimonas sp.]|nr:dihydrolipoyllysine-residue acetyltransferase [Luteimonas sp.]
MASPQEARVPDIGGYDDVPVIEVLVAVGESVAKDQGLVTLESDKATMEVPAPFAGVIRELRVKVGDTLSEGGVVAVIDVEDGQAAAAAEPPAAAAATAVTPAGQAKVDIPDAASQPQVEPDSSVEPVAPQAKADNIAQASIDAQAGTAAGGERAARNAPGGGGAASAGPAPAAAADAPPQQGAPPVRFGADALMPDKVPYASPAVRLFARELGVDLQRVTGSARGGRIVREDVQQFVKGALQDGVQAPAGAVAARGGGLDLLPWPKVDFSKFGAIETRPLTRIQKISGANLSRNWAMIPHVTQHDDADVTELEALRVAINDENAGRGGSGIKLTMLAFLMKATVSALRKFPDFNASLDASGETLTLKKYFHVGFAADTPNGLVVPVVRDVDRKGVLEIAQESSELAKKARDGKLGPAQMQGGCFSISSLGGIGGTAFTPIVNAPEVAILGVSKSAVKPVWDGTQFAPRLLLPLSLSYDHRVIDGASAARFTAYLAQLLGDMRRMLL